MSHPLRIEPLRVEDLEELAIVLRHPAVYEHLGGVPSLEDFLMDRQLALLGPSPGTRKELWLNFLVREHVGHAMIGRLEATIHHGIAEVAFLLSPNYWGRGYAREALHWLHAEIIRCADVHDFWATTIPENTRCQALLNRCGYKQVLNDPTWLRSFEPGDLVYHRKAREPYAETSSPSNTGVPPSGNGVTRLA